MNKQETHAAAAEVDVFGDGGGGLAGLTTIGLTPRRVRSDGAAGTAAEICFAKSLSMTISILMGRPEDGLVSSRETGCREPPTAINNFPVVLVPSNGCVTSTLKCDHSHAL